MDKRNGGVIHIKKKVYPAFDALASATTKTHRDRGLAYALPIVFPIHAAATVSKIYSSIALAIKNGKVLAYSIKEK